MAHLFVIAGHGSKDPGAEGNGYQEAERVRALASRLAVFGRDNVTIGDTNRNLYEDKGLNTLSIPSDWQIIELHMDSSKSASARGGHVIIKSGLNADKYDNALANFLKGILPGRSSMIVGRDDLANPNRAAARGLAYRLVEFGFISNQTDVNIFNSRLDDIAKGVLRAFDIGVREDKPVAPPKPVEPPRNWVNVTLQPSVGADTQRWKIEQRGDYYRFINKGTGYALDLADAKTGNDSNIQACTTNGTDAQLWRIIDNRKGLADYKKISPKLAQDKYLSIEKNGVGGNNVKIWQDLNNSKQEFYFRKETDGYYIIIHTYTGKAITAQD